MTIKRNMFLAKKSQTGRSMVEMLGVLAVIGVLAISGIWGMQYTLQIHAENETVDAFTIAVTGARTEKNIMYLDNGIVKPSLIASVPEQDMYDEYFTTNTGAPVQVRVYNNPNSDNYGYTVSIAGISREVCEQIKYSKFNETCAQISSVFTGCGDQKLAEVDCTKFDEYKPEGSSGRESALQLTETIDLDYTTAASTYGSLIVFFGAMNAHINSDSSDEPDAPPPSMTHIQVNVLPTHLLNFMTKQQKLIVAATVPVGYGHQTVFVVFVRVVIIPFIPVQQKHWKTGKKSVFMKSNLHVYTEKDSLEMAVKQLNVVRLDPAVLFYLVLSAHHKMFSYVVMPILCLNGEIILVV